MSRWKNAALLVAFAACDGTGPNGVNPFLGRIIFESDRTGTTRIFTMLPDGADVREFEIPLEGHVTSPDVSPSGEYLAFRHGDDIYIIRWDGQDLRNVTEHPANDYDPKWAPNGVQLAFTSTRSGAGDVYLIGASGTGLSQLTNDPRPESLGGDWSPDGSRLAFTVAEAGGLNIYIINADGSGRAAVTTLPEGGSFPSWSPDGARLAFIGHEPEALFVMNADGTGRARLDIGSSNQSFPAWSPDGGLIAFTRIASGDPEVALIQPDGAGGRELTSNAAYDARPVWGPADE